MQFVIYHHRLRFPSLLGHCACSTGGFHLEPLVLLRGPLVPSSFPTLYCISRPLTPNWVPLSATIRVRYSPLLTPISDWVNPPLHEYCNFTCVVSYHLDFHQLDLGSFTGPFPCRHPAGIQRANNSAHRFIVSCEGLYDMTSQLILREMTAPSIPRRSPIVVLTALGSSLTSVI